MPRITHKTMGQAAYERDLAKTPKYHDGGIRPTWEQLGEIERWSWERTPMGKVLVIEVAKAALDSESCLHQFALDIIERGYTEYVKDEASPLPDAKRKTVDKILKTSPALDTFWRR